MRNETIVLNHTKMAIIDVSLDNYIQGYQEECFKHPEKASAKTLNNAQAIKDLDNKIQDQLLKPYGSFGFTLRDCANISILVHDLWTSHKREFLQTHGEKGRHIRKNLVDTIDEFSSSYYDLSPNVEDGMKFRKALYVDPTDANC